MDDKLAQTEPIKPDDQRPPSLNVDIPPEQVDKLKNDAIVAAKQFALRGKNTRKEAENQGGIEKPAYNWWENQAAFEGNTWSVSFWDYDDKTWQIQGTKIELQPNGHSLMTSYSIRQPNDPNFPGFQVYKEQSDDRYKVATIEEIVYLNRCLQGMLANL